MRPFTRREVLSLPGRLAGAAALGLPLVESAAGQEAKATRRKLKVVVAGAHPDDPESGCGGTAARYADLSHEVVLLYLTRGEAGIKGKSHEEAARIRTAEAQKACEILQVRPVFAGQIDAATELNPGAYDRFHKLFEAEAPDVVFTHWPIDSHRDHRTISLLVYDAWLRSGKKFALYYFEVYTGIQTQDFWPTHYVDITTTEERKRAACLAHASLNWAVKYWPYHEAMDRFRGFEAGYKAAEAFICHAQSGDGLRALQD